MRSLGGSLGVRFRKNVSPMQSPHADGAPGASQAGGARPPLPMVTTDISASQASPTPGSMAAEDVTIYPAHSALNIFSFEESTHARGETSLVKVADENMPADFLTKWIDTAKLRRSVEYATNARAAVH